MKNQDKIARIGIFGHYGNENLGDEAITTAVIQNIRMRMPQAVLCLFSVNPHDTAQRYGIPAIPVRKTSTTKDTASRFTAGKEAGMTAGGQRPSAILEALKRGIKKVPGLYPVVAAAKNLPSLAAELVEEAKFLLRAREKLKELDLLLIAGSNQFLDSFGGPLGFPYTLLKWTLLAKSTGVKVVFVSVGAGPLESRMSKLLIGAALIFSDYISFRDRASKHLIVEEAFFRKNGAVYPDLAYSLLWNTEKQQESSKKSGISRPVVGINPMAMYDSRYWYVHDDIKYKTYVRKLAWFSSVLLREGYPVFFFPTQPKDENVIRDVMAELDDGLADVMECSAQVRTARSVDEIMAILESADLVVATRFHGTLLSLLAGKPVLGICYYRKAVDLMYEVGQGDYVVELDHFDVDELLQKFRMLEKNADQEAEKIRRKNEEYQVALSEQYEHVLGLLIKQEAKQHT